MNSAKSGKSPKAVEDSLRGGRKRTLKAKAVKDPNAPKKAMTAFMLFSGDKRAGIRAKNPDYKMPDVAKECGRLWKEVSDDEKAKYQKKADSAKQEYEKKLKEYNSK